MFDTATRKTIAALAREDLLGMFRQMAPVLGVLGIVYIIATMCWFIAPAIVPTWIGRYTLRMLMFAGLAWASSPFYVALHRFVAYREVRWLPSLRILTDDTRIYAAYSAMSVALFFVPFLGREVLTALGMETLGGLASLVLLVAVWIVLVRAITLLPMAALDPLQASWTRAFAQSKGRSWRFFIGTTIPAIPAFAALTILNGAVSRGAIGWPFYFPLAILALLAMQLLPLAIATRIYRERVEADVVLRAGPRAEGHSRPRRM